MTILPIICSINIKKYYSNYTNDWEMRSLKKNQETCPGYATKIRSSLSTTNNFK
jgi:hypothetical protein